MNKIKRVWNSIQTNRILRGTLKILILSIITIILLPFIMTPMVFLCFEIYEIMTSENFTLLTGSTAIILTLSSILFSASRSALGSYERVLFYENGKRALFASILLIISLLITYLMNKYNFKSIINGIKNNNATFVETLVLITTFIGTLLVLTALKHIVIVIYKLINNIRPDFPSTTNVDNNERIRLKKYYSGMKKERKAAKKNE